MTILDYVIDNYEVKETEEEIKDRFCPRNFGVDYKLCGHVSPRSMSDCEMCSKCWEKEM